MNEDFLHYVWKYRLFDQSDLKTTKDEAIRILHPGEHNLNAGPDFFNAKIKYADTLWVGNVEIHIKASDWRKHFHQEDEAYNNVVLHVVLEDDEEISSRNGNLVPALELKYRILPHVLSNYRLLDSGKSLIPCGSGITDVPSFILSSWLERLMIERLEEKTKVIKESLIENHSNWEETFYYFLAQNFGFRINAQPFLQLAKSLPLNLLAKHRSSLLQLEALLFGQSGMLSETFSGKYPRELQNEYAFLMHKNSLRPMQKEAWKFLRMRPGNFPSLRIAEFASLIHTSSALFSRIIESGSIEELKSFFKVNVSEYWKTHYVFDRQSVAKEKRVGEEALENILVNTAIPFLFIYGKEKKQEAYCKKALGFLESLNAEDNSTIRKFVSLGIKPRDALQGQAMLQLYNRYCSLKKCLHCSVGNQLLSKNKERQHSVY
ncbi:MAG: DUF2851 family protein [Bacteroidia bacterium]